MAVLFSPIRYTFNDEKLLKAALTHRSRGPFKFLRDGGDENDNQRLEALGAAVLELFVVEHLYFQEPRLTKEDIHRTMAGVLCEGKLAEIARDLSLGKFLNVSTSMGEGGSDKASVLADALRALLGAVYLDGGPEEARSLVRILCRPYLSLCFESQLSEVDFRRALYGYAMRNGMGAPVYSLSNTAGPVHMPTFSITVKVGDCPAVTAAAPSKKLGAQRAAKILFQMLMSEEGEPEVEEAKKTTRRKVVAKKAEAECPSES
jgi:ribonuclease-3